MMICACSWLRVITVSCQQERVYCIDDTHIRTVTNREFLADEMISPIVFMLYKLVRTLDGPSAAVARLISCVSTATSTPPPMVMPVIGMGILPIAMF